MEEIRRLSFSLIQSECRMRGVKIMRTPPPIRFRSPSPATTLCNRFSQAFEVWQACTVTAKRQKFIVVIQTFIILNHTLAGALPSFLYFRVPRRTINYTKVNLLYHVTCSATSVVITHHSKISSLCSQN